MLINTESLIKNISSVSRIPFRQIPKIQEFLDSNQNIEVSIYLTIWNLYRGKDSNFRQIAYETIALPTELPRHK